MDSLIYYSDDPNLGRKVVKTISGGTEYRANCKKIKDGYYVINKDCFLVGDTWYRLSSGLIDIDHETKKWFLKKAPPKGMLNGVVDVTKKGEVIFGSFTANPYKNIPVHGKTFGRKTCISQEVAEKFKVFTESVSTGVWMKTEENSTARLKHIENALNHTNKGYNIEDNANEYQEKKALYEAFNPEISKEARIYSKMLGDLTFGAELECSKGYMPDHLQNQMGIVVCRDGSLKDENGIPGPEFVTIPLSGAKGVQTLASFADSLCGRTQIGINCSYHIHLGNLPTSRMFLVSLYRLSYKIQNEVFQMFPFYKANPEGIKSKNYNQKLPSLSIYTIDSKTNKKAFESFIDESYKRIFSWLADGHVPDNIFNRKVHKHPQQHKWDRSKRYFWMNAMNTIFSERNTVEFRPHTPTTNAQKVVNWLYICNAIVRYASNNHERILMNKKSISLAEVLSYYANTFGETGKAVSDYLIAYVEDRKQLFFNDYEKGDKLSQWDIDKDQQYKFSHNGITNLF